jgi:peroxiredoxin
VISSITISRSAAALVLVLVLGAGLCWLSCGASRPGGGASGRAADFSLRDTAGRTVRLSDHLGKVVLVNFWATWCVPCAAELPHLQRLYETHGAGGFVVLAIAMDGPESVAGVGPFARRYGLTFPVLLDEETSVVAVHNPRRTAPFTVLIGRDGAVAGSREGYTAGDEVALEAEIRALLDAPDAAP